MLPQAMKLTRVTSFPKALVAEEQLHPEGNGLKFPTKKRIFTHHSLLHLQKRNSSAYPKNAHHSPTSPCHPQLEQDTASTIPDFTLEGCWAKVHPKPRSQRVDSWISGKWRFNKDFPTKNWQNHPGGDWNPELKVRSILLVILISE